MQLSVLKGVSCPDYRSTLMELHQQGWSIEKTNGGHLKLTHKEAGKPVYSSTTTSDYRSRKNLVSLCRNAILLSRGNRTEDVTGADLTQEDIEAALRRSKSRKKGGRQVVFDRHNPLMVSPDASEAVERMQASRPRTSTAIPTESINGKPLSRQEARKQADALFAKNAASNAPSQEQEQPQPTLPEVKVPDRPAAAAKVSTTPCENKTTTKKDDSAMEAKPIDTSNAEAVPGGETSTPIEAGASHPVAAAPAKMPSGLTIIPDDVMTLALKIASGKFRQVEITPEMVGKTLLIEGEALLSSGMGLPQDVAPETPRHSNQPPRADVKSDKVDQKLLDTIREFAPEPVTQKDLADLLHDELGYRSTASAAASFSRRLAQLSVAGELIATKKGQLKAFQLA